MKLTLARAARPASHVVNLAKSLFQAALFWMFFFALVPALILKIEALLGFAPLRFPAGWTRWAGTLLFGLGGTLGITSALALAVVGRGTPLPLDAPRQLVMTGPYRYVRNPMAIAGLAQGIAVGLYFGSWPVVLYALLGGPLWHFAVRPWEEADLARRFGAEYERYREQVRCWWPRFSPPDDPRVRDVAR